MSDPVCWIDVVDEDQASDDLKVAYDEVRRPDGSIHKLYQAFSLFPAPLVAADRFYRDTMHAPDAPLPMWLAELLSVDVAIINGCEYATTHHGANFVHLFDDREQAERIVDALRHNDLGSADIDPKIRELLVFGRKLTRQPDRMSAGDLDGLRAAGYGDAEILQAIQVSASFAYWTRFINALGIEIGDEKVGKYD